MDQFSSYFGGPGQGSNAGNLANTAQQANQANQLGGNLSSGDYTGALGNAGQMFANQSGPQSGVLGQAQTYNLQQQQASQSNQLSGNYSSGNYMGAATNAHQMYSNQKKLNEQQGTPNQGFMGQVGQMGQSIHQGQQIQAQSSQLSGNLSSGNYLGALGGAGQLYGGQTQQTPQTQPTGIAGMMVNSSQAYGNLSSGNYQGAGTALGGAYTSYTSQGQPVQVSTQGQTSIGEGAGAQGGFGAIQSNLSSGQYGNALSTTGTSLGSYYSGQSSTQGQPQGQTSIGGGAGPQGGFGAIQNNLSSGQYGNALSNAGTTFASYGGQPQAQPQVQTSVGSGAGAQGGFGAIQSSLSSGQYGNAYSNASSSLGSYYGGQSAGQAGGQTQISQQAPANISTNTQAGGSNGFVSGLQGAYGNYQQSGRPF